MAAFDKDNDPLGTSEALQRHIAQALAVSSPNGLSVDLGYQLVKRIFNPVISGLANIPEQPCLFVGNHSLFALDGMVLAPIFIKQLGRFPRSMGDKFLFSNPRVAQLLMANGAVMGHPDVCTALMRDGQDLLVFPGGAHEAVKPASELYALQWKDRLGFVRLAAAEGYTIMPFGLVGPDEFYNHLMEGRDLPGSALGQMLSRVGLLTEDIRTDILPPIPRGSLGTFMPKPQRCYLGFGEPVDLGEYQGQTLGKKKLQSLRSRVAKQIEEQLTELLFQREQHKGDDSLVRRFLCL